jgi:hypothetical protein
MVRMSQYGSFLIEEYHYLQLKLPAILLTHRYPILPRYRIFVKQKHLVRGNVEVPGKLPRTYGFKSALFSLPKIIIKRSHLQLCELPLLSVHFTKLNFVARKLLNSSGNKRKSIKVTRRLNPGQPYTLLLHPSMNICSFSRCYTT